MSKTKIDAFEQHYVGEPEKPIRTTTRKAGKPEGILYYPEYGKSIEKMRNYYDLMNKLPGTVASEVTFTFAPGRCADIQDTKKRAMRICVHRLSFAKHLVGAILFRENHENGWPHIHGIVWFEEPHNNALTLSGGRLWIDRKSKSEPAHWVCSELGNTRVDPLRTEPYKQHREGKEPVEWQNWFEYIIKDQTVKWTTPNALVRGSFSVNNYFSDTKVETID